MTARCDVILVEQEITKIGLGIVIQPITHFPEFIDIYTVSSSIYPVPCDLEIGHLKIGVIVHFISHPDCVDFNAVLIVACDGIIIDM